MDDHGRVLLEILQESEYDRFRSSPSDEKARLIWIIWAVISGISVLFCCTLLLGILLSPKARKSSFNLYIILLTIPDIIFNAGCCISYILNATYAGQLHTSKSICQLQSWCMVFGITAISWTNGFLAINLQKLLRACHKGEHFRPPVTKTILREGLLVYLYAMFVASWAFFGFLPHQSNAISGLLCLPVGYSTASTLFFWLVFVPAAFGIPFILFLYILCDVYRKKMLSPKGRTRGVFLFFMRLTIVFVVMWLPALILIFASPNVILLSIGVILSHLQGMVSVLLCLTKLDIRISVINLITCTNSQGAASHDENTWMGLYLIHRGSSWLRRRSSETFRRRSSRNSLCDENDDGFQLPELAEEDLQDSSELDQKVVRKSSMENFREMKESLEESEDLKAIDSDFSLESLQLEGAESPYPGL